VTLLPPNSIKLYANILHLLFQSGLFGGDKSGALTPDGRRLLGRSQRSTLRARLVSLSNYAKAEKNAIILRVQPMDYELETAR